MSTAWPEVTLGEICTIERGRSPRPIDSFITTEADGVNWVKIGDASRSTKYITKTRQKIAKAWQSKALEVKPGDFLLSNSMSFGRPYIMRTTGAIHDGWLLLRDERGLLDENFLYHLLGSPLLYAQYQKLAAGTTVRNLNIELVSGVKIPLPPLDEQRRIAAILDKADEVRSKRKAALETLETLSQAIFIDMFGDPVTNPMGWPISKLSDISQIVQGGRLKLTGNDFVETGYPAYGAGGMNGYLPTPEFDKRAVVLSSIGARCGKCFLTEERWTSLANTQVIIPNPVMVLSDFLWVLLNDEQSWHRSGTAQPFIKPSDVKSRAIALPPLALQDSFSNRTAAIQRESLRQKMAIEVADLLFASLQQKAFQGAL